MSALSRSSSVVSPSTAELYVTFDGLRDFGGGAGGVRELGDIKGPDVALDTFVFEVFSAAPLELMPRIFTPPTAITRSRGDGTVVDVDVDGFWTAVGITSGASRFWTSGGELT